MNNFLSNTDIQKIVATAPNKQLLYRTGVDFRYTAVKGRNKPITLEGLLHQAKNFFIKLEENTSSHLVFHGYSSHDME